MFVVVFGIVFLATTIYFARRSGGRTPLFVVAVAVAAVVLGVLRVSPLPAAMVVFALVAVSSLVAIGLARAARRAAVAGDHEALERYSRFGFLLTGSAQWRTFNDLAFWKVAAATDHAAARPLLERVAHTPGPSQPYYELVLEAAYGNLDVPALIDQRWSAMPAKVRPLLHHLAVTELLARGRTNDALARLAGVKPSDLTKEARLLITAELAAATGDSSTFERLAGSGDRPPLDPERTALYRGLAMLARGEKEAGTGYLRSLDLPPAGRTAREIAKRLDNPLPRFDEATLDEPARRGLEVYRRLAKAAAPENVPARP